MASQYSNDRVGSLLRGGAEAIVLGITVLSPWAFAAVHPLAQFVLYLLLAAALVLWATILLLNRHPTLRVCPVLLCIIGIAALGLWQLIPFPDSALAILSPGTSDLRSGLFPDQMEEIAGEDHVQFPQSTLSLDPGATRSRVVKLIAVLALFAVVRFGFASPESFRRFAIACVGNGAVLSVFALAQKFSSPPDTLYWSFESQGNPFGPFVCRNHFPFYINACFGLGVGLLLERLAVQGHQTISEMIGDLSRHTSSLWIALALGLMLAASVYSMSRGGFVALMSTSAIFGTIAIGRATRMRAFAVLGLAATLALGLVVWFGLGQVTQRLGTLNDGALSEGRGPLWERTAPLALQFPIWGTGYGTFESVEPMQRQPGDGSTINWQHAHNDYLESMIEGGLVQFTLIVTAIFLIYRRGILALRRTTTAQGAALALGGLFGLTTIVIHSFAEFGMQMAAIVILATVLTAHLVAAGDSSTALATSSRIVARATAVACLAVAVFLPIDGWRLERAEQFHLAAERAYLRQSTGDRDQAIYYSQAAVDLAPENSLLRLRLAEIRYEEYLAHSKGSEAATAQDSYLLPALRDYLITRSANPLYHRPHGRLAGERQYLRNADTAARYLDRACRLAPADGSTWYLAGLAHFEEGDVERAASCWRNSLRCTTQYLSSIVRVAYSRLGASGLVEKVIPSDSEMIISVSQLPDLANSEPNRRLLLSRALELTPEIATRSADLYRRAWLLRELGDFESAIPAYQAAIEHAPDRVDWRIEFVELLYQAGNLHAAADQVRLVLRDAPDDRRARDLNSAIVRARVGGR
jgi:tetratricopeptide (TPR) repeat protein/O-antigen ligase